MWITTSFWRKKPWYSMKHLLTARWEMHAMGGAQHVFSRTEDEKFKPLKTIDFCGGRYPSITSGPETFKLNIPSIAIDGTSKKIP